MDGIFSDERDATEYALRFHGAWNAHVFERKDYSLKPAWMPEHGWATLARTWRRHGIELDTLLDLVEQVLTDEKVKLYDKWRYLCGCCRQAIDRQGTRALESAPRGPRLVAERVTQALGGGPLRRVELAAALGVRDDDGDLGRMLRRLLDEGRLVRPRRGLYALA